MNSSFYCQLSHENLQLNYLDASHPTVVRSIVSDSKIEEGEFSSSYVVVTDGEFSIHYQEMDFPIRKGFCAQIPGNFSILGKGKVVISTILNYKGIFTIFGSIEEKGRIKYIDGCSSTVLINPLRKGDPCLNFLYVPPGISQTYHQHPSLRVGVVLSGEGTCQVDEGNFPMLEGTVFCLPEQKMHSFRSSCETSLRIAIYHPDSIVGPTDDCHTMLNNTFVEGQSAELLEEIKTQAI